MGDGLLTSALPAKKLSFFIVIYINILLKNCQLRTKIKRSDYLIFECR